MLGPRLKTPGSGGSAQRSNDRSSTRTARGRTTRLPGVKPRKHRSALRRRSKLEDRRQAKLHSVARPVSGSGIPSPGFVRPLAQDESVIEQVLGASRVHARHSRESNGPEGARLVESVAEVGETHLSRSERRCRKAVSQSRG